MADEVSIASKTALTPAPGVGARIAEARAVWRQGAPGLRDAFVRRFPPREIISFGAIGAVCTLLFVVAYHFARSWLPPLAANGVALTSTVGLNFAANRWFTFRSRGRGMLQQASQYVVFYAVGLGASSMALWSFLLLWPEPPRGAELTAALLSGGLATAIRYLAMTLLVFRPGDTPNEPVRDFLEAT
jgi:putative flippase GtrA